MRLRMPFDDVAWEESERVELDWVKSILEKPTLRAIGDFIVKHRRGTPTELCDARAGAYNVVFRMKFQDGGSALIRFPKPGATMFPEEKVHNEVAIIRYIQDHTSIPVPFILHWGTKEESPLQIGPFIIMEWINHETDMGTALNTPGFTRSDRPVLDPNIEPDKLESLYRQFANILFQLSRLEFPAIGSLEHNEEQDSWAVTKRPLSIYMNELVRVGSLPRAKLPRSTYQSTTEYLSALSKLHIDHFASQRNDSFDSRSDCERKFVARQLFHKTANDGRLLSRDHERGPFRLFFDDLRPQNILLDANLQVVGVVDWEFCYVGPAEFASEPPWWLLLEKPEYWAGGMEEWTAIFEDRLQIFLKVMEECEAQSGVSGNERSLASRMRDSWRKGDFWITYAARKNFAFDYIFWNKIEPKISEMASSGKKPGRTGWRCWMRKPVKVWSDLSRLNSRNAKRGSLCGSLMNDG